MKNYYLHKKLLMSFIVLATIPLGIQTANAAPLAVFASWNQFANDDGHAAGPGVGGQDFDAEYLFYKISGNVLSLGLQTGFDVIDGAQGYPHQASISEFQYYSGDLSLAFNNGTNYDYAVDFGLLTKDYYGSTPVGGNSGTPGIDTAGLYKVATWGNDIIFHASDPFAMQAGTLQTSALIDQSSGWDGGQRQDANSYYRIVNLDLSIMQGLNIIDLNTITTVAAHWTMSCGNDNIIGRFDIPANPVPEPATMLLLGTGLAGLAGARRRKK